MPFGQNRVGAHCRLSDFARREHLSLNQQITSLWRCGGFYRGDRKSPKNSNPRCSRQRANSNHVIETFKRLRVAGRAPRFDQLFILQCEHQCSRCRGNARLRWLQARKQNNCSLDLLTEVGAQCERAVIVQLLVTRPPHGIAHSFYLDLSSEFQSFPICPLRKHELRLPNLAR